MRQAIIAVWIWCVSFFYLFLIQLLLEMCSHYSANRIKTNGWQLLGAKMWKGEWFSHGNYVIDLQKLSRPF